MANPPAPVSWSPRGGFAVVRTILNVHRTADVKLSTLIVALAMAMSAVAPARAQAPPAPPAPPAVTAAGAPNLNISPKRIAFDRNHRSGTVFIFNQGTGPGTFDISLVDRVMLPSGQIMSLEEAQADLQTKVVADRVKSAQPVLQISPRRVTLNPGQGQTIRLRVTGAGAELQPTELRSHLTVATLPPREAGTTAEGAAASTTSTEMSFRITALFGLSVPAIVRLNDLDVRAGLENAHVAMEPWGGTPQKPGPMTPILTLDLVRLGSNSLFGNLEVRVRGQTRGAPLGTVRGLGVYTEIERRPVKIELSRPPAPGERLEVTFTDDDTSPGKLLANILL